MGIGRDGLMNSCWSWVRLLRKALRVVMAWRETWRETRTKLGFKEGQDIIFESYSDAMLRVFRQRLSTRNSR